MLQKILAIASIQDRIDLVAADYNYGADLFAEVSGHELLKALGESRDNGDMTQYRYRQDFRESDTWSENLSAKLAPFVTRKRMAKLEEPLRLFDEGLIDEEAIGLNAHEEKVLQLLHDLRRCEHDLPDFGIRTWSVEATDGTCLFFHGFVGDGGEVTNIRNPYLLRKGFPDPDGVEYDHYVLESELAKLVRRRS
jgi:hypothetical protein